MDELVRGFADLTLPSRSSTLPNAFRRLDDTAIERLLQHVRSKVPIRVRTLSTS